MTVEDFRDPAVGSDQAFVDPFPGVTLKRVFGPEDPSEIFAIAWAPDGQMLATGAKDRMVRLWSATGQSLGAFAGHEATVLSVAFCPTRGLLASGSVDTSIRIWDLATRRCVRQLTGHTARVTSVAWSADGKRLVSGSDDGTVRRWLLDGTAVILGRHTSVVNCVGVSPNDRMVVSASEDHVLRLWDLTASDDAARGLVSIPQVKAAHAGSVHSACFSPDGSVVAAACADATVHIWEIGGDKGHRILEGHTTAVRAVAFSPDGRFLVSKSDGGTVRLWRCDSWQPLGRFPEATTSQVLSLGISRDHILATFANDQTAVCLWRLDPQVLLATARVREQYCNAKVVLLGDSGVGKSGLALALSGRPFSPTESTHGREVWQLDERVVEVAPDLRETREILLWDLAGQPAYRFVHQLHLHDTTVAVIVFDARNDLDPVSGVRYWDRALRQARRGLTSDASPLRKVLVVARVDRGGVAIGRHRFAQLCAELGITEHELFETSAKHGQGIAELRDTLHRLIDWDRLPKVTSTRLFHDIKSFVASARGPGHRLLTVPALCDAFLATQPGLHGLDLRGQFETCVGRLESRGVVRSFAFGNYVLLEPELLDAYASAIVEAAREEPDGLGIIAEDQVRAARFRISDRRLADPREEELLLIATIESLVHGEIALRETTDDGVMLLFPAQSTREPPPAVAGMRPSFRVAFEGAARSVYATLAVRLTRSGVFQRGEVWRDGILVRDALGAHCGVRLRSVGEAGGEIEVLVSAQTAPAICAQLEQFVHGHVVRRGIAATVRAERVLSCKHCGEMFHAEQIRKRREHHKAWITCSVCDERTLLGAPDERPAVPDEVRAMDRDADRRRELEAASITLQGKQRTRDFDVFLCHHSDDKPEVKAIGKALQARGIHAWLDEWELPPGQPWLPELEAQIASIRAAAVFIGGDGAGPWQNVELRELLAQFVERGCPVIPVILSSVTMARPKLPAFLRQFTWVDYRLEDPPPLDRLIWGITKVKPRSNAGEASPPPGDHAAP